MKTLVLITLSIFAVNSFAGAKIINKEEGTLKLTGMAAKQMLKTILDAPVKVTSDSYELVVKTYGQDFNYNRRYFTTGKITCLKTGKSCIVKGSEIRNSRDGWFSPEVGFYRVFGMGTLSKLDKKNYFKCDSVYANVACDFKIK